MSWTFNDEMFTFSGQYYGFVYKIENIKSGKLYFGKKQFTFKKTKIIKGKRKKYTIESDWFDYWGSCDELNQEIQLIGSENFNRTILYLCHSKSELSYYEAKVQFEHDVLLYPDKFYNKWISVKVHGKNLQNQNLLLSNSNVK